MSIRNLFRGDEQPLTITDDTLSRGIAFERASSESLIAPAGKQPKGRPLFAGYCELRPEEGELGEVASQIEVSEPSVLEAHPRKVTKRRRRVRADEADTALQMVILYRARHMRGGTH